MRRAIVVPIVKALGEPGNYESWAPGAVLRLSYCALRHLSCIAHATYLHPWPPWQHRGSCF